MMSKEIDEGVSLFNAGLYFEAHETWGKPWKRAAKGSTERLFLQGLIMISTALKHYGNRNDAGASKLLKKGMRLLERYRYNDLGVDAGDIIEKLEHFYKRFATSGERVPESEFPRVRMAAKPGADTLKAGG